MGIFDKLRGNSLQRTSSVEETRIKNILGIRELESMPAQAAKAFQLASDPKATSLDFVKVIEKDEALSSRVVRVANSVYFFRGTTATDIEKAVANIGLNELRCLISATMLRSLLQSKHEARIQIWSNSVSVAIGCRLLSSYTNQTSDGEAFLGGLVHDLGKLIMIRKNGRLYERVIMFAGSGKQTFVEAEEEAFETTHTEVGKWVAEQWNFPQSIIGAIAQHHNPWPTSKSQMGKNTSLPVLVKCSDVISHALGIGHGRGMKGFQEQAKEMLSIVWKQLEIDSKIADGICQTFERQFRDEERIYDVD